MTTKMMMMMMMMMMMNHAEGTDRPIIGIMTQPSSRENSNASYLAVRLSLSRGEHEDVPDIFFIITGIVREVCRECRS